MILKGRVSKCIQDLTHVRQAVSARFSYRLDRLKPSASNQRASGQGV